MKKIISGLHTNDFYYSRHISKTLSLINEIKFNKNKADKKTLWNLFFEIEKLDPEEKADVNNIFDEGIKVFHLIKAPYFLAQNLITMQALLLTLVITLSMIIYFVI